MLNSDVTPILANGIALPVFLFFGFIVVAPVMAFLAFAEGGILHLKFKLPWRDMARVALRANVWSLLAGIPVFILNALVAERFGQKRDLFFYLHEYFAFFLVATGIYFVVTVLVESLYLRSWFKKHAPGPRNFSVLAITVLMNLATYAVLSPIYYARARPTLPGFEVTVRASSTNRPVKMFYIHAGTGHLRSILTNGEGDRVEVNEPINTFWLGDDGNQLLYRTVSGAARLISQGTNQPVPLPGIPTPTNLLSLPIHGTGHLQMSDGSGSGFSTRDLQDGNKLSIYRGLGSGAEVFDESGTNATSRIRVRVPHGLWGFSGIWFESGAFLPNGKECIIASKNEVYLVDFEKKRIGKLADASSYVLMTPRFRQD